MITGMVRQRIDARRTLRHLGARRIQLLTESICSGEMLRTVMQFWMLSIHAVLPGVIKVFAFTLIHLVMFSSVLFKILNSFMPNEV